MDSIKITACLKTLGLTLTDVAESLGVTPGLVCSVVHRRTRSGRVEAEIARILGAGIHQVFPDWYRPDGGRKRAKELRALTPEKRAQAKAAIAQMLAQVAA
jgi:lambda repressor-like predicted transcriptional regulator